MNHRYLVLALSVLLTLLSGCITKDFSAQPNALDSGTADTSGGDDAGQPDATAELCETNQECQNAGDNQTGICTSSGTCRYVCSSGFEDCDGDSSNGCEADLSTDVENCGECEKACQPDNTNYLPVCVDSQCTVDPTECIEGYAEDVDPEQPGCECITGTDCE